MAAPGGERQSVPPDLINSVPPDVTRHHVQPSPRVPMAMVRPIQPDNPQMVPPDILGVAPWAVVTPEPAPHAPQEQPPPPSSSSAPRGAYGLPPDILGRMPMRPLGGRPPGAAIPPINAVGPMMPPPGEGACAAASPTEPDIVPLVIATEPINAEEHEFIIPKKEISLPPDVSEKWEKSEAYQDLLGFIGAMNDAVKNKKNREDCYVSETVRKMVELLDTMDRWITEIPPIDQPQRFGNKAYRDWFTRLQQNAEELMRGVLPENLHRAVPEVTVYLVESVGNCIRIDYGTGHEMAFVAFLCCLFKIGALQKEDSVGVVLRIFSRYLEVMRKLQLQYRMEPAGSQGVWSLDDFQFVPFIWGSSQLRDHQRIKPKSFPDVDIAEAYHKDYLFLGCINFINKVKTGPFAEHSNQLWNISGVPLWSKVNSGLIKMYKAEVLSKFPVIQHFLFGSLMSIQPAL